MLAVHFIDRKNWLAAGPVGAIATGTRSTGIVIPLMIVAAVLRAPGMGTKLRGLLSPGAASAGLIAYSAFCHF
ncbi:MAG: hypothetical protein M3Y59_24890 [Myxococcota bacterium]|nr:hypothetical protein [Myxococcota bacterium]